VVPERIWMWGHPLRRKFFWSCPSTFLALKVQLVVLVSAFAMVIGQYSLVSLLFAVLFYSRFPRAQPFVKVGTRAPVPYGVGATDNKIIDESFVAKCLYSCTVICCRRCQLWLHRVRAAHSLMLLSNWLKNMQISLVVSRRHRHHHLFVPVMTLGKKQTCAMKIQ